MALRHISPQSVIQLVTLVVIIHSAVTMAKQSLVKMDKEEVNSNCGKVFILDPGHEVKMTANGMAPDGYCGVTMFAPKKKDNYTCDALCVTFKTASISTCDVKVKFIGHQFGKSGDVVREFNCHQNSRDTFCLNVNSMRVEVVETYNYAYKWNKALYEFDIDVSSRCTKDSIARRMFHHTRARLDADEKQTYIEGIAVGVSLACVFLVVLFVGWCYTKHQAVVRSPSNGAEEKNVNNANNKGKPVLEVSHSKSDKTETV